MTSALDVFKWRLDKFVEYQQILTTLSKWNLHVHRQYICILIVERQTTGKDCCLRVLFIGFLEVSGSLVLMKALTEMIQQGFYVSKR